MYVFTLRYSQGGAGRVVTRGPGDTEAGQVGALEEGLSGLEAGRCVLPSRSAVNDSSVACPGALFCRPSPKQSCDVGKTINIITYTDV